jgi:hypothetical protein
MLLERSSLASASAKAEPVALLKRHLAQLCEAAEARRNAPCQYPKYARSGRAADAVRGHSFSSAPTRSGSVSLDRSPLPFFVRLTPARWEAKSLAVASGGVKRVRGAVLTEPFGNQRQNLQAIDNVAQSGVVPWFRASASRDVRGGVCVCLCAYVREGIAGTSEPLSFIYVSQWDRGSGEVLARFSPEPALRGAGRTHGFAPISNILVGRYAPAALDPGRRGLMRSRAGERFGVFGLGGRADRAGCASSTRRKRNGGKASVFGGAAGVVGTLMLERRTQSLGKPRFFEAAHLPSGKAAGTPPCPLSRSRSIQWGGRSRLTGFGSAFSLTIVGTMPALEKSARSRFRQTGSGEALRADANPGQTPGRGYGDAAEKPCRMNCMGGGIDRVK